MKIIRMGSCKKCGQCCQSIFISPKKSFIKSILLWRLILKCSPLYFLSYDGIDAEGDIRFSCKYLQKNGKCQIHQKKPWFCQNYPTKSTFLAKRILPNCGYSFKIIK